jgi:dihydrofolate reductase
MISLIWAMDENKLIGHQQQLPWHFKDDLAFFTKHTKHQTVLMGYQTYLSLIPIYQNKPWPYQKVFVATKTQQQVAFGEVVHDIESFLSTYKEDLWILGGANIYQIGLKYATDLYITYVLGHFVGDTYFPNYHLNHFKLVSYETKPRLILSHYRKKVI